MANLGKPPCDEGVIQEGRSAVRAKLGALDTGRHPHRLQHGLYRQHGNEHSAAGLAARTGRHRRRRPVDRRVLSAAPRPTDDGRKCYPYAEARALYERGLMYARRPDPGQGRHRLEEAVEIF